MKPVFVFLAALAAAHAADYKLTSSPGTVVWGNYWAGAKPVLRIQSGDTVEILTMSTSSPAALARVGVKDADIQPEWKAISANQPPRDQRGPGGHVLTGPIFIEGAEPGDVLDRGFVGLARELCDAAHHGRALGEARRGKRWGE